MNCKICEEESNHFSKSKILNKYVISYFLCPNCGFLQTEKPYWLNEAYSDAITKTDIGTASRNNNLVTLTRAVLSVLFNKSAKFVDYGGGYGLFVRLMRDNGFNYYRLDKYCDNIFAKNFEANIDNACNYEVLTAFEVFEHLVNPIEELDVMFKYSKNILFTTNIFPKTNPYPTDWWYYGLDHGQHISIYSIDSLKFIAKKYGLHFYTNGVTTHLFTSKKIPKILFKILTIQNIAQLINFFSPKKSLLEADFNNILNNKI